MSERDKAIEEAKTFLSAENLTSQGRFYDQNGGRYLRISDVLADFALAYHAKQNAEAEKLREDALKFYSADGSFTLGESPEQVVEARIEAAAKIEKLAKLEAWVNGLMQFEMSGEREIFGRIAWQKGSAHDQPSFKVGERLADGSYDVVWAKTPVEAIYAYLEQAEGGEE